MGENGFPELLEVRLLWKSNKHIEMVEDKKTGVKAEKWVPRKVWIAKLGADGRKESFLQDEGEMVEVRFYQGMVSQGKVRYVIREDGTYEANECDKFDKDENLRHTFRVVNGIVVEGHSKKFNKREDVQSGFALEHINADGTAVNLIKVPAHS